MFARRGAIQRGGLFQIDGDGPEGHAGGLDEVGCPDEDLCQDDRQRREGNLQAEAGQRRPEQPAPAERHQQRQSGDRRRQHDGQVKHHLQARLRRVRRRTNPYANGVPRTPTSRRAGEARQQAETDRRQRPRVGGVFGKHRQRCPQEKRHKRDQKQQDERQADQLKLPGKPGRTRNGLPRLAGAPFADRQPVGVSQRPEGSHVPPGSPARWRFVRSR